ALFLDEPTVGAMNRIGLDFNALGNHEFDRGWQELVRMQQGGCAKFTIRKPCGLEPYAGAKFPFLAANTVLDNGKTLFPGTGLKSFGKGRSKVTIGFIGMTLKGTGGLSSPENIKGLHFEDEADTANALIPGLKAQGADAIVVLIHLGGRTKGDPDPQSCEGFYGDIIPVLNRLSTQVDVVVSGHSHWDYVCDYAKINPAKPFLLTSAGVFGEEVTDIALEIDPKANRVVSKRARNVIVQSVPYQSFKRYMNNDDRFPQFTPRKDVADYVARYTEAAKAYASRPVGKLAGVVQREGGDTSRLGGTLGSLIADAQLEASKGAGAEIAFMNPFGLRAPHTLAPGTDGSVTFGQIYAVQPFNNTLVTQTLTGAEIKAVLEQGFDADQPIQGLSPSHGFSYEFDVTRPIGDRVVNILFGGQPLDMAREYRVTTNSFLANGGDSFTLLAKQRASIQGIPDAEALEAWLSGNTPRAVPSELRVRDLRPDMTPIKPPTVNDKVK
ncbi:MAG: bifunctional metallophosphatase/5'-nucleotidase, partial [Novosphingobium sp.]